MTNAHHSRDDDESSSTDEDVENFVNRRVTLENADLSIGKGQKICIAGLD